MNEKNNFQDRAESREYKKGFRAGSQTDSNRTQGKSGKRGSNRRRRPTNRGRDSKTGIKRIGIAAIETGSKPNDPNWYIPSGMLANGVAQIPQTVKSGLPIKTISNLTVPDIQNLYVRTDKQFPGILVYDVYHTMGDAFDQASAINVAGNQLYQMMQSRTSRILQYGPPQVMMQIVATSEVLALYHWMTRIYGYLTDWSIYDSYKPEAIVQAMGCNFTDFKVNRIKFRNGINVYASALNSLYMPKAVDYTLRRTFLYSSIYTDSNDAKAQMCMFNPLGFWKYVEGQTTDPLNHLEYIPLWANGEDLMKVDEVLEYANNLLQYLMISDDVRECTSDMIRTFGEGQTIVVNEIAETFALSYEYSREILMQMENAYILPRPNQGKRHSLYGKISHRTGINESHLLQSEYTYAPDTNSSLIALIEDVTPIPQDVYDKMINPVEYLINFHDPGEASPEDIIEATRLSEVPKTRLYTGQGIPMQMQFTTNQTEAILGARLISLTRNVAGIQSYVRNISTNMAVTSTATAFEAELSDQLDVISILSNFDWAPRICPWVKVGSSLMRGGDIQDLDNYFRVPPETLSQINDVCLRGQFTPRLQPVGTSQPMNSR